MPGRHASKTKTSRRASRNEAMRFVPYGSAAPMVAGPDLKPRKKGSTSRRTGKH